MKIRHLFLFLTGLILSFGLYACANQNEDTSKNELKFNNGTFKIVQFTDLHWTPNSDNCATTEATIKSVLEQEKPDLAILTGDVVTEDPAKKGWDSVIKIFEDAKMPFVVTLGNHDAEYLSKDSIYNILLQSPFYVGNKGPKEIFGCGNCDLPIYGKDNKVAAVLYCIDSNDYLNTNKYGAYDWIHNDQIEWYRATSDKYTAAHNGKPIPSLAFFHIPLLEMNNILSNQTTFGNEDEVPVASPMINSGLFGSIIDKQDVMGVFVGHDHDNDYLGLEYGVALGFGRVTGTDAYGHLVRGGRIIQLYEGQAKFDTWITTPQGKETTFYYPSGLNSKVEAEMTYLPALDVNPTKNGVNYTYLEGKCKKVEQINDCQVVEKGVMPNFSIQNAKVDDHFAYIFEGYIKIDETGVYKFYTHTDDGSQLFIDNQLVVDNDGGHSPRRREGQIALDKGFHHIKLLYFEDYMGEYLEVGYSSKNIFETQIPNDILFTE